ncbi:MAG: hypothetical protein PHQ41_00070 [Candidatus Cloacimonetes bacterium]|nr:hypothetical protein [Candidatus Cloacimonadota bacterium]
MILVRTEEQAKLSITGSDNKVRWMIAHEDGSNNFEMRHITLPPGGKSSKGSHPHEHVVYVLEGVGRVVGNEGEQQLLPHKATTVAAQGSFRSWR